MALDLGVMPTGQLEVETGGQRRIFDNLVLEQGWQSLLSRMDGEEGGMVPRWLSFGTGEGDPDPGQDGLEQRVASTEKEATSVSYGGQVDASMLTAYSEAVVRFDYEPGELTGEWTELGLAYGSSYSEPYNRALIRDENGLPTPLLVMSDEPVTVYARLRLYLLGWGSQVDLPELGVSGSLSMTGDIESSSNGLWLKGLPIESAVMGDLEGVVERREPESLSTGYYFVLSPTVSNWSASQISFRSRSETTHVRLNFSPMLTKPYDLAMYLRIRISIAERFEP